MRLVFENGRVVHSEATSGESYLHQMLSMDDGASVLGELAIGTNYGVTQFTKQILFDEKIGGTCHMALGVGLSGHRQPQQVSASLGHGPRSARRRRDPRRRRADLPRRRVPPVVLRALARAAPLSLNSCQAPLFTAAHEPAHARGASHDGRSWRRSTATPRNAAIAATAAVPSSDDSGSPSGAAVTSLCEQASSSG